VATRSAIATASYAAEVPLDRMEEKRYMPGRRWFRRKLESTPSGVCSAGCLRATTVPFHRKSSGSLVLRAGNGVGFDDNDSSHAVPTKLGNA
jgi:hypothetical protein